MELIDNKINIGKIYEDVSNFLLKKDCEEEAYQYFVNYRIELIKNWDKSQYDEGKNPSKYLFTIIENTIYNLTRLMENNKCVVYFGSKLCLREILERILADLKTAMNIEKVGNIQEETNNGWIFFVGGTFVTLVGVGFFIYNKFRVS